MRMDTARTNTPAGYPVRRSATPAWPLCICSFGHRALKIPIWIWSLFFGTRWHSLRRKGERT